MNGNLFFWYSFSTFNICCFITGSKTHTSKITLWIKWYPHPVRGITGFILSQCAVKAKSGFALCFRFWEFLWRCLLLYGEDSRVLCWSDHHGLCCHHCSPHREISDAKLEKKRHAHLPIKLFMYLYMNPTGDVWLAVNEVHQMLSL